MSLIFGLGNPGKKYGKTLHNAGFLVCSQTAKAMGGKLKKRLFCPYKSFLYQGQGENSLIVLPLTGMNRSGLVFRWVKPEPDQRLIVVCDNMDLGLGTVRIKKVRKLSTHRGLRSIQEELGSSQEIIGLFVGIGNPSPGEDAASYVLSGPRNEEDSKLFMLGIEKASLALRELAQGKDLVLVQAKYNARNQKD